MIFNNDWFIEKSKLIHGNKYDYSLVDYKNLRTKVKIICPEHDEFEQTPDKHFLKRGCPYCGGTKKLTKNSFVEKANKIHNNYYDYSLVDYKNSHTEIKIICSKHGEFGQLPHVHLSGSGCKNCGTVNCGSKSSNTEDFIMKAKKIHSDKYDYSLVDYKLCTDKVKIICKKHKEFEQAPNSHLKGSGCPICNNSKGENIIINFLSDKNIKYIHQKKFNECKNKSCLPFDFYLLDYNLCIEYDGIQHFESNIRFGGDEGFKIRKNNDNIKNNFCQKNDIKLLRIKYDENIIEKLEKNIK